MTATKRAGFDFELLDLDAHEQPAQETELYLANHRFDVVAMGCIVTGYRFVKRLSLAVKKAFPDTTVIVGNTVASSISEILLTRTGADIAVCGEGDITLVELLQGLSAGEDIKEVSGICYLRDNKVICSLPRPPIDKVDEITFPDWDSFDLEPYIESLRASLNEPLPPIPRNQIRPMPINTARGCPYNCTFCYHAFRGYRYRPRSPESIIAEIEYLRDKYGVNYIAFNDELTLFSIYQAEDFVERLLSSNVKIYWRANCRSGLFNKDEHVNTVRKLKEAGCLALSFSLESADSDILNWMGKKVSPGAFSRQVEILREGGLPALTSIVIGYPNETPLTIRSTIDCCIQNGIYPSAGYLLPQPGTPMYEYALEHGYIKDEEEYLLSMNDRQNFQINMTQMTDEEFQAVVESELARCSRELGLELSGPSLLKTGHYRVPKIPR